MDLPADAAGKVLDLTVVGDDPSGCPFLMLIPVDCKRQMGGLMYKICMQALVATGVFPTPEARHDLDQIIKESGVFPAPEAWHDLDQTIKEAWGTIEIDMLRKVPADTESGRMIAKVLR